MTFFAQITRIILELARSAPVQGVFTAVAKHALRAGTAMLVRNINQATKRKTPVTVR